MMKRVMKEMKHTASELKRALRQEVFEIEYEIFPLRSIYYMNVEAETEEEALEKFWASNPRGIVRSVNDVRKPTALRNPNTLRMGTE